MLMRDAVGVAALIAAAGYACWFLLSRMWEWLNGAQQGRGGRVVRDRSMGGKSVFIPNQPLRRVEVPRYLPPPTHSSSGKSSHLRKVSQTR